MKEIKTIGIIGYGKFSKLLKTMFEDVIVDVQIKFSSRSKKIDNKDFFDFEDACKCDIVIPSVPIKAFEKVTREVAKYIDNDSIFIDVCSIKSYPKKIMIKELPVEVMKICTHPMYGPESYKHNNNSVEGFNIVIENINASEEIFNIVKDIFIKLKNKIVEISAERHDELASEFHFTTLTISHVLKTLSMKRTEIDTVSASRMHDFVERIGADMEITEDMYNFNPFCSKQFDKIKMSIEETMSQISNKQLRLKEE
ncbi:MAG: prephenate dehydrogenase/arogenate dehydrogenase family protein [Candidatus Dojkabacteria bacterium]|nr:prephenate dehydrogenase/arogenate dehydrogenase family protein [Candidatus Dojkabacteria bacterium]